MIYKFVSHEVPKLETLKDTRMYQLHDKLEAGVKLKRDDKDYLYQFCEYSHGTQYHLAGWCFDFTEWLNHYAVKRTYGTLDECFALDKTAIRNNHEANIYKIYQLN